MNNKEHNYIMINSNEIKRPTYKFEREFYFNDFHNIYYFTGDESVDKFFDSYEIPIEYRKIVFLIKKSFLSKAKLKDVITDREFIISSNDNNRIKAIIQKDECYKRYHINSTPQFINNQELIDFYNNLKENHILTNYIKALSSFYRLDTNTKNIRDYKEIISKYRNNEYTDKNITLHELLSLSNNKDLLDKMSISELELLKEEASGISRLLFIEEMDKKIENKTIKVK